MYFDILHGLCTVQECLENSNNFDLACKYAPDLLQICCHIQNDSGTISNITGDWNPLSVLGSITFSIRTSAINCYLLTTLMPPIYLLLNMEFLWNRIPLNIQDTLGKVWKYLWQVLLVIPFIIYYFLNFSFFWHNLIRRWIVMNHFQCWGSYNGRHKKKKNISFLNNSHSKATGVFKYVESFKCIYCVFSWTDFLGWKGVC